MYERPSNSILTLRISLALKQVSTAARAPRTSVSDRSSSSTRIAPRERVGEYAASSRIKQSASASVLDRICNRRVKLPLKEPPACDCMQTLLNCKMPSPEKSTQWLAGPLRERGSRCVAARAATPSFATTMYLSLLATIASTSLIS